ncbi:type I restriction enzyme S subunit [Leucobacter luti]|uniref:restriction endonuclease subunit S n=1 Tax=Leucobacter luti TaxID=340320 RepID=UPI00104402D1|nr:restriction endonuclease subunit S [Leucobacter luti]MCW2286938.1 type I restriction enzyme S subunit [Leucobacter luti]TCK41165.1 type I restriction enzyme S subunit [Leucobacter luti]
MSRIEELIAEECPDGVPYLAIGSASVSERVVAGATPKTGVVEFWEHGTIPWMSSGEVSKGTVCETDQFITQAAYDATSTKLVPSGTVVIALAGQGKTRGTVARTRIELCTNQSLASIVVAEEMDSDFLYYYLQTQYQELRDISSGEGTRGGLNLQMIKAYKVPVPPIEVQRAIVEILDMFSKLDAELDAELEARKEQYGHYRAGFLEFDLDAVDTVVLSDGFETRNGYTPPKSDPTNWANGTVPWFRMEDIRENGRVLDRALQMIPEKAVKGGRHFPANSLIFATSATIGEHALVTVPYLANQRFTAVWPKQEYAGRFDMKFLFHYGFVIDGWCRNNTTTSSFASVDMSGFKRLVIPIPPLETQKRIAEQLDKFDALVNDLSIGLPAELAARRQQYKYYRDKLLTFNELKKDAI